MSRPISTSAQNEGLARQINEEARSNPHSTYAGKFVGVSRGRVAGVADSLDELVEHLRQSEPDMSEIVCFEAGLDYDQVQEIWRVA